MNYCNKGTIKAVILSALLAYTVPANAFFYEIIDFSKVAQTVKETAEKAKKHVQKAYNMGKDMAAESANFMSEVAVTQANTRYEIGSDVSGDVEAQNVNTALDMDPASKEVTCEKQTNISQYAAADCVAEEMAAYRAKQFVRQQAPANKAVLYGEAGKVLNKMEQIKKEIDQEYKEKTDAGKRLKAVVAATKKAEKQDTYLLDKPAPVEGDGEFKKAMDQSILNAVDTLMRLTVTGERTTPQEAKEISKIIDIMLGPRERYEMPLSEDAIEKNMKNNVAIMIKSTVANSLEVSIKETYVTNGDSLSRFQLMDNLKTSLTDLEVVRKSVTMIGSSAQARRHLLSVKSYRLISDMAQLRRDIAAETLMALDMAADLHLGG